MTIKTRFLFTLTALLSLAVTPALRAHPGHGWAEEGAVHLLTSPDHFLTLALLTLALAALSWMAPQRTWRLRLCTACSGVSLLAWAAWLLV